MTNIRTVRDKYKFKSTRDLERKLLTKQRPDPRDPIEIAQDYFQWAKGHNIQTVHIWDRRELFRAKDIYCRRIKEDASYCLKCLAKSADMAIKEVSYLENYQ